MNRIKDDNNNVIEREIDYFIIFLYLISRVIRK